MTTNEDSTYALQRSYCTPSNVYAM